jgi:hypothetical protein
VFAGPSQPVQGISGPAPAFDSNQEGFSSVVLGATSGTMLDRLVNNGDQPLLISSITLGGTNPGDFHETNNCPTSLSGNLFCTISLTFTPTALGSRQASVVVADNGPGGSQSITLSGTGLNGTPAVTLSSGSVTFATILAGTVSAAQNVTVTNSGTGALHVSNVALSGANPGDFKFSNGCTAAVAIGGNCTVGVTFSPVAAGQRTAQVTISDDAANSPQAVSLTGNATSPYTVAPSSSSSQTIKAGASTQYALTLTPTNGFSGTVQLTCSGAPQGATCVVPASVQATSGTIASFNVSVTTTMASNIVPLANAPAGFGVCLFLALFAFLVVLLARQAGAIRVSLPAPARTAWQRLALVSVFLAAFALAGCGAGAGVSTGSNGASSSGSNGGTTTNPPVMGTPAGTYTLTVTATSGNVVVTSLLTLTVQ